MIKEHSTKNVHIKYDNVRNVVWAVGNDPREASNEIRRLLLSDWMKVLPETIIYKEHNDSVLVVFIRGDEVGKFIHPSKRKENKPPKKSFTELARTNQN